MSESSPFDHRPDRELGALLRDALTSGGEGAFVGRVMSLVDERDMVAAAELPWWQVLRGWARPGLAAALVLAAGATVWAATAAKRSAQPEATLETVFLARAQTVAPAFLVASTTPPSFDRALASSLEP
jgi:hypothetical protein